MLSTIVSYRLIISRFLVSCYLLGTLQVPTLEVLHLMSHLLSGHDHGGMHFLSQHSESASHEFILTMSEADGENMDGKHLISKKMDNETELFHPLNIAESDQQFLNKKLFFLTQSNTSAYQEKQSPPPK